MSINLASRYAIGSGERTMGLFCPVTALSNDKYADATGVMSTATQLLDGMQEAGFSTLQLFPPNPGNDGDCPYFSISGSAGDHRTIDLVPLVDAGWLSPQELEAYSNFAQNVDAGGITTTGRKTAKELKHNLLTTAFYNFENSVEPSDKKLQTEFKSWREQTKWLDDYAAFVAISSLSPAGMDWERWTDSARDHTETAMNDARQTPQYQAESFIQWVFRKQAAELKGQANERGIAIITDRPAYPRPDSADVWGYQDLYLLEKDKDGFRRTSGCPPDYFAARGQMWGHFLPDWGNPSKREALLKMKVDQTKYLLDIGNLVREDHARAIGSRWAWIGNTTVDQPKGEEMPGPGQDYFDYMRSQFDGDLPIFLEDLGFMPPETKNLLVGNAACMSVIQFAPWNNAEEFNGSEHNPQNGHNRIVYASTHDNPTTKHWYDQLGPDDRRHIGDRLQAHDLNGDNVVAAVMDFAIQSNASHVIATYGDVLNLGEEGLLNIPGETDEIFWRHRMGSVGELVTAVMTYKDAIQASGRAI